MPPPSNRPLVFSRSRPTLDSFATDLAAGATGLEATAWRTADGVAVLDDRGYVGSALRRRPVRSLALSELPDGVITLAGVYEAAVRTFDLALDVPDPQAARAVVGVTRSAPGDPSSLRRLWLMHADLDQLTDWRDLSAEVRLVNRTRMRNLKRGPERRAAELAEAAVDAVSLPYNDWSRGLVALFHRFDRLVFAYDASQPRVLRELANMGVDGIFTDHLHRMTGAVTSRSEEPERTEWPDADEGSSHDE